MNLSYQNRKKLLRGDLMPALFLVAGILLVLGIVAATSILLTSQNQLASADQAEHDRLRLDAFANAISDVLWSIDNTGTLMADALKPQLISTQYGAREIAHSALFDATDSVHSVFLLDKTENVLLSSNPRAISTKISLRSLGLSPYLVSRLTPGTPLMIDGSWIVPFARLIVASEQSFTLVVMLNVSAIYSRRAQIHQADSSQLALLGTNGWLLSGFGPESAIAAAAAASLQDQLRTADTSAARSGEIRHEGGASAIRNVQYRRLHAFSLVALIQRADHQTSPAWSANQKKLQWGGTVVALILLICTLALWRFMRNQAQFEKKLSAAKEAADHANAARGEFLSTMSHEIRTPMNAVIGMAELIRATPLDAQQETFAKGIQESATALMAIIDDILDFSRIDAGKLKIEIVDLEPVALMEACVDVLAPKAMEKRLLLSSYIDPQVPAVLSGDPGRLRQILLNLLSNAVKFTSDGEVAVSLRYVDHRQDGQRLRFAVTDSGIGIGADVMDKLFTPFSQADSSVTRKYGGTGLGLSICKRLVELMGGTLGLESRPGFGSTFWFELSLPSVREGLPERGLSKHVLIAASPTMRTHAICDYVRSFGATVRCVDSALEAIRSQPDPRVKNLVLVETGLPDLSPQALVSAMRARGDASRFILLAQAGELHEEACENARLWGFDAVLAAPVRKAELFQIVGDCPAQTSSPTTARPLVCNTAGQVAQVSGATQRDENLILLVEDNLMNQKVAIHQLNMLGYSADIANDGQEALHAIARNTYALVLMDCQMPVLDGFNTARRIRDGEYNSDTHLPIIAMTANAMQGDRERCIEAGMDDYMSKPILTEQLQSMLKRYLPLAGSLPPSPESAAKIVDARRMEELFGDDRQSMCGMLELFISSTGATMLSLQGAVDLRDFTAVQEILHRLAGSSGNLGLSQLNELVRAAEHASHAKDIASLQRFNESILSAFQRLRALVHTMKETT
jgi:signal transduction histidine kinase/DNA-binding response OmpR family regulator